MRLATWLAPTPAASRCLVQDHLEIWAPESLEAHGLAMTTLMFITRKYPHLDTTRHATP